MKADSKTPNSWIFSARLDLLWIIGPGILAVLIAILADWTGSPLAVLSSGSSRTDGQALPPWLWLILIPGLDVSHVYSTLFRAYFDRQQWQERRFLLSMTPLFCFLLALTIYSFGKLIFWRAMAYLAVFHFIRQQYGFLALYSRKEPFSCKVFPFSWDKFTLYAITLLPILYWHVAPNGRNFEWFMEGDFYSVPNSMLAHTILYLYWSWIAVYSLSLIYTFLKTRSISWPKNLFLLNTGLVWYVGIIALNDDLSFTITNVVNHGIPYMALVFLYGKYRRKNFSSFFYKAFANTATGIIVFAATLLLFAYSEEWLWDTFVWKDHSEIFGNASLIKKGLGKGFEVILVPLFFLPQFTHYVLDGFLWKVSDKNRELREFFGISII
ncbi:putative membrane protein [Leptospira fainei serovar Hurstbridge str. BUT 6]|uniref:Membrane protein n=1 Tax=Leptospira fainei serovar Hurstbridge str. BUT 6 TaxID=1193011 RepID=S3UZH6_9LEPT|nr:hypothetical protein [Leptospira fainei]EPG74608.1 putative membrane protein [Leptospira fainei serovar Hurstbridge str. BUT 6]